jgi:D-3-phosphoglycerate dehydrogenase / 2-oxoglutarate reductase
MPLVLITHPQPRLASYFGQTALTQLKDVAQVRLNPLAQNPSAEQLIDLACGCDAIIAYRQTAFARSTLAQLKSVRAVVRCAVDIRSIDVSAASDYGILITQASPGFQASVAEWVLGVMIDLSRGISRAAQAYWAEQTPVVAMGRELRHAQVVVVGYGEIGRYLCPLLQSLGMHVTIVDPHVRDSAAGIRQLDLDQALPLAHYVICLAPANAATENMFDAKRFAQMQAGAFFINASRGNLVHEPALLDALESQHLAGAALDVGRAQDQMPSPALARHPKIIATPHVGGLTPAAIEHQALETVRQVSLILQGSVPSGSINAAFATRLKNQERH